MADRDSERDRRVRELLSGKKKDQMAVLGQSRAEVQDIQSELQNHIALQQSQDQARLQQAQTISQAAEGMLAMEGGDQLQGQVASMNPQTQATLGKYGVKPERVQNMARNQSGGRTVSKSGDITNIKNETITNNKTEIKVTQPTIPMSQPNIPVQAATHKKEDNTAKFKAWLSGMFAKQQNEAEIQKKEYRKKEWNLGRTTSRLMKRIEESTTALGQKLDPRNMTSTLGGQLKWLLLIFGATMIAKVWKPTMKFLANLEGGFRAVFGLPMNTDLQNASSSTLSVIDQIKGFIGIKKGEDTSLIGGIGRVFMEGIDKLIDKLKFWFEDRATALRDVEFPSFDTPDFGPLGKVMAPIMEGLTDTFKGMTQYLGDLITVALGGSKGRVKVAARKISRQAQDVFTDTSGKKTSVGDEALIKGNGRNYMRKSDYDSFGNLKSNASSTQAMSQSLISMFNDKSGKAHTAEISTGIGQLFDVADRSGKVVISPELLGYLGLTQADVTELRKNKYFHQEKYRIIGVKPTTDAQREEIGAYTGNAGFWAGGIGGTIVGALGGGPLGAIIGGYLGSAGGTAVDEVVKRWTTKGLYPKIVPSDSHEVGDDGSPGIPKMMWVLTKKGADIVTQKFTKGMTNKDMDITNQEFYEKIRKIEERRKRLNGVSGPLTQNLPTNELNIYQANYAAYNQRYHDKFVSTDPNSENMRNYGHYNTAMGNISGMISNFGSAASTWMYNAGNFVVRERLGKKEQNQRAMYVINRLMKEGLSEEQAAGITANIMKESGFEANKKILDNNHKYAGGLVGWNGPNLERVERYFGKDIRQVPFEDQVEYLVKELKGEVNGIKAINRDGYASRFGFRTGANVLDVMKRTRNVSEATVTFERIFEGSGDYKGYVDKNGIRRGGDGDKMRIEYGLGFLKFRQSNPNSGTDYKSAPIPQINLSDLQGSEVKEKKVIGACWIGDSQSCVDKGAFPILVGQGLGCLFYFYARGSANATHYLGKGNTKSLSSPVGNIPGVASCKEALDWIIKGKPKYCFIELGHNGMNGYQELVNKLQSSGIKVICIKMWSTQAAPGTKMRSYTKEQASEMYKNIKADGFIDLTQIDIPKSKDGVHASSQGCIIAAREVLNQLSGGKPTTGSVDEDYLKTQDGIFGSLSSAIGGALDWVGNKLDPTNKNNILSGDPFGNMTKEQRETVQKISDRNAINEALNIKSWESLGAKSDEKGTYFQNGDIRTYVRTDEGHSGLFGLKKDDINWIERVDRNGKTSKVQLTDDELEIASNAAIRSVSSMFTDYPEKTKGQGFNDFMLDKSGKPIGFYIGKFKDLDSFKDPAPSDFGGKIEFYIFPTKDMKRYTMVGIGKTVKCSKKVFGIGAGTGEKYYGPIIYHKGARWFVVGTEPQEKKYSDFQPICQLLNVRLTPQANIETQKLLNFLNTIGSITVKDGKYYGQDGQELSEDDLKSARTYGILDQKNGPLGVKHGFNEAVEKGKSLETKNFNINKYSSNLGIGDTQKDREKYYKTHKSEFRVSNGIIYGPQGVKWGTIDNKGKISFYDNNTMSYITSKEGDEGIKRNIENMQIEDSIEINKGKGYVSREKMAQFMMGVSNYTQKETTIHGKEYMRRITIGNRKIVVNGKVMNFPYSVSIRSDGTPYRYYVKGKDLANMITEAGGLVTKIQDVTASNLEEMDKKIINNITNNGKNKDLAKNTYVHYSNLNNDKKGNADGNKLDKLTRDLIKKGKKIKEITWSGDIHFEDGSVDESPKRAWFDNLDTNKWKSEINSAIDLKNSQLRDQAIEYSFKKSGLDKVYQSFAEDANNNKLKYISAFGNYVATTGGDVFGIRDPKTGKIRGFNGKEAYNAAFSYFNQEGTREDFLKQALGLQTINGKNYYQAKNGNTVVRTQIDTSKDLSNFMSSGIDNISTGIQKYVNGKWVNITDEEEKKNALASLRKPINEMVRNSGFTNKLIKMLNSQFGQSTSAAAKVRIKQLNTAVDQKTQQKKSNEYLKTLAENVAREKRKFDELKKAIKDIDTTGNKEKVSNERLVNLAETKLKGKNLENYEVFSGNFANGNKLTFDITTARENINKKGLDADGNGIIDKKEAKGAKKIAGWSEQGSPITIINSGGNYYAFTKNGYKPISDTGETMSSYTSD